ncbi:MAG: carbamoyltransferase C-terminal domain-containing protein [Candidatus Omnitrophota bacterium]
MIILGISAGHESGAALLKDGDIIFAASEERYARNKMITSMPFLAVKEALSFTKIKPEDIDIIAVSILNKNNPILGNGDVYYKLIPFTKGKNLWKFYYPAQKKRIVKIGIKSVLINLICATGLPRYLYCYVFQLWKLKKILKGFRGKIEYYDHHDCHVATAYLTSDFKTSCLSVVSEGTDGKACFKVDLIDKGKFTRLCTSYFPHSPGHFYELSAEILGFNPVIHCGKITGLAAYGNPDILYSEVSKLMWVSGWNIQLSPLVYTLGVEYAKSGRLPDFFKNESKENIAAAFQKRLEDCIIQIVSQICQKYNAKNILFSGGTAANVRLNQKLHNVTEVDNIYIHPGMSDCGQPLGAALLACANGDILNGERKRIKNVFFGGTYSNEDILLAIKKLGITAYDYFEDINDEIARLLSNYEVIAVYNGRMEYGPRALGNRSILYHAGDPEVNNWLNHKLKRSEFMPFAPAILAEHASKLFTDIKGKEYTAEFMTITCNCSDWMKEKCPAVVHIDGTARPQLVYKENNPHFYDILHKYYEKTGIPVLINTSFNIHNEPIVGIPEDALRSHLEGGLKYLAIGNYLVHSK